MKKRHKKKSEPPSCTDIEITLQEPEWTALIPDYDEVVHHLTSLTLQHAIETDLKYPLELSVVLANDTFIQTLNRTHRDQDKPTNVLAFPNLENPQLTLLADAVPPFPSNLGDVVLALETCKAEAFAQDKSLQHHFSHLLIHGLLHLLGFDHLTDKQANAMESLEMEILQDLGIKNPYDSINKTKEDNP